MYSISRVVSTGPPLRAGVCDSCSRRNSSSLQRILDLHKRTSDTSEKWKRPAKAHVGPRKGVPVHPFAGGFVKSHPGPKYVAGPSPISEPYLPPTALTSEPHKGSPDAGAIPGIRDLGSEQASPSAVQPKSAIGGARFFFLGMGASSAGTLPSVEWEAKQQQDTTIKSTKAAEPVQKAAESAPKSAESAPKSAESAPKAAVSVQSRDLRRSGPTRHQGGAGPSALHDALRNARERNKPSGAPRSAKGESAAIGPTRQRERGRPDDAAQVVITTRPKEEIAQPRTKPEAGAPKRAGRGVVVQKHKEEDDRKRRRRKFKLPKKGKEVTLPLTITVDGLAKLLDVPNDHLMRKMANIGMDKLASDYLLSNEEAADLALEYGVVPIIPEDKGPELYPRAAPEDMSMHPTRPPVVTIMGHVDHGKTTLLDTLRSSSITATEAGGITQHIGAFSVQMKDGQNITFLDTPGHAAFSAMRARGANATDIVVLVVAADDGVMPQTKEAIQHALDADVPIIVAINKCDKPGVDPSLIKEELLQYGIQTEDMGGDIQATEISALKGDGVGELAESISTLAEVLDLRAEVDIPVHATVIESQIEKGRGGVASVLVKRGTLKIGDVVVAGTAWCKVRGMSDDRGKAVESAGPATAVKVMGWKEVPQAGDMALQAASEAQAKDVVSHRVEKRKNKAQLASVEAMNEKRREVHSREDGQRAEEKAYQKSVWEFHQGIRASYPEKPSRLAGERGAGAEQTAGTSGSETPVVPIVIKGDVSGTVEAVTAALKQLPSKKIRASVLSTGVGPVAESDVAMAGSSEQGVIIAFNVKADKKTQGAAKRAGVQIMSFRIIYKLLEEVEKLLLARLPPLVVEEVQGEAVVQQVFEITLKGNKTANIAGSRVMAGTMARACKARVLRDGKVLFTGDISSLKNVKNDVPEVTKGQEFGISFAGFDDLREGDIVHSIALKEIPQKLE